MRKRFPAIKLSLTSQIVQFVFIFTTLCSSSNLLATENQSAIAQRVFQTTKSKVFQIKTAISPESPKSSYGSAWIIDKDGLLVTNYHVVSQAIQKTKSYQLYLVIDDKPYPATIKAVDVTHDLAIIKVNRVFPQSLALAKTQPTQGAKIFSVGLPEDLNMSITEGNYNNIIEYGPYQLIHMASPLNPGMSGGPTLNANGEVVGVNVSVLMSRQSISFAVPNQFLLPLLKKAKDKSSNSDLKLQSEIESQLIDVQNFLTAQALSPREAPEHSNRNTQNIGAPKWNIQPLPAFLKCWSDSDDDSKSKHHSVKQICYVPHAAFIDNQLTSGSFEISWQLLSKKKLNTLQLYQVASDEFNAEDRYISLFLRSFTEKDDLLTRYTCNENLYKNSKNILFATATCMRGYKKYASLLNLDFKAKSLTKDGDIMILKMALSGFTYENAKKMIEKSIESIEVQ